jgi:hypothetical protein
MPAGIVPESFLGLLAAFATCFGAPSYRAFELLVVGWVHCLGRRTITAVALASGGVGVTSRSSTASSAGPPGRSTTSAGSCSGSRWPGSRRGSRCTW